MKFTKIIKQTPNISKIPLYATGIVLHHTGGSYAGSVDWCLRRESKVSYHVIIDLKGDRTILAKDNQITWHSGRSSFMGRNLCNNFMLGIAISGDTYRRLLTEDEIESVALLCVEKMKLHNFGIERITTHRRVSPNRKIDIDVRAETSILNRIKEILNENQYHTVIAGDNLWNLSKKYNLPANTIKILNDLKSDHLGIDQKLKIK